MMTFEPFTLKIIIGELCFYYRFRLISKVIVYYFMAIVKINVNNDFS